ncbi:YqhA family protein [Candidatus Synechococcus calcipolaris G9]|uniref:YqhA family protein n=1 Tax=Candidatus Synechococcus calcipolaris G9 TaxID=1497997 RepID=A0ABT6ETT6_9SYNE|nr:YqhA family protein [Candidatus Synechococcus calcipolaris]MDG2989337.1 YqhA family protein [Candidatus Synechococcus calcipolaris G9]
MAKRVARLELFVESFLWYFRLLVIIPVAFSLISVVTLIIVGSEEIVRGIIHQIVNPNVPETYTKTLGYIITGIDIYIIAIILLIFALGIYELFISKIDIAANDDSNQPLLESQSLDRLKDKLLKAIVMALVITFFKQMLSVKVESSEDLLLVGAAVLIISISSYLMQRAHADHH